MKKICVVVASRANYSRLKSVLRAISDHPGLELTLIVGASALLERFGCVDVIEKDDFAIDERIYTVVEGDVPQTMASTTGLFTIQLANVFERHRPDVVLVHADRYEMLAVATAASYMNIPVAHTEGGEETGSIDDKVRNAISQLADIHFPVTQEAAARLCRMDVPGEIHVVGSPALDVIADIDFSERVDLIAKYGGVGPELDLSKPYLVVLQHPVTTEYGSGAEQIEETLNVIRSLRMQTIWLWPNVDSGTDAISETLRKFRENEQPDYVHFFKNLSPEDYARLIHGCACLIGNTSSGIKEGAFLGVPYVCIGTRQNRREHGENVLYVDYDARAIQNAVERQIAHGKYAPDDRFGDGQTGEKIAEVLYESFGRDTGSGRLEGDSSQEPVPALWEAPDPIHA